MNTNKKILTAVIVIAMMAFSAAAIPTQALVNNNSLTIVGSSTVYPIAVQASSTFPSYWNSLVDANPSWGASRLTQSMSIAGFGSGTAFKGILPTSGAATADVGEMSRPPSQGEWDQTNAANAQVWAIGVDSVAIVLSPSMTWVPTQLTAQQAAKLFMSTDAVGTSPYYNTWGDFLTEYYGAGNIPAAAQAHTGDPINRAVRDFTSGTYDCWNNFFGKKVHDTLVTNAQGEVIDNQYMAPYYECITNMDVYNRLQSINSIGFISLGYLTKLGNMIGVSIENGGQYYAPSQSNVIAGTYVAWRWLWEVTPQSIPTTGNDLETGVWIAYLKLPENTVNGNPDFVTSNDYMAMPRADMAGGPVLNSALQQITPKSGQTQTFPDLKVDANDFFYFVDAYIHFYSSHTYNPYADFNANGVVDSNDFFAFVNSYIQYYISYNPSH